jgi:hypothetical protein
MNAAKHGLAAITPNNPAIFAEIEPLAVSLCNGVTHPLLFEQALIIAENAFVLRCVQVEYIAAIERHRDITVTPLATGDLGFAHAKATLARAKLTYKALVKREAQACAAQNARAAKETNNKANNEADEDAPNKRERDTTERVGRAQPIPERDEFDAMASAMPDLDRLDRYRRRAWSRQRRAIRRFMEIQSALDAPMSQLDGRDEHSGATGELKSMADAKAKQSFPKTGLHEQRSGLE